VRENGGAGVDRGDLRGGGWFAALAALVVLVGVGGPTAGSPPRDRPPGCASQLLAEVTARPGISAPRERAKAPTIQAISTLALGASGAGGSARSRGSSGA